MERLAHESTFLIQSSLHSALSGQAVYLVCSVTEVIMSDSFSSSAENPSSLLKLEAMFSFCNREINGL